MKRFLVCLTLLLIFGTLSGYAAEPTSFDGGWIKISQIQQGVYRFEENGACCYLVIGHQQAVLIDAAYGVSNMQALCSEFTKLPVTVINTHGHIDHVGGDQYFNNIIIHEKDAPAIESDIDFMSRLWALNGLRKNPLFPQNFNDENWHKQPIKPIRKLSGGEVLDFGDDIHLEVIWTPGHTPGSICLLDRDRHLLFAGDTFVPGDMWMQLPESSFKDWIDSAEKIAKLQPFVQKILSGHGSPSEADMLKALGSAVADIRAGRDNPKEVENPVGGRCLKSQFPLFAVLHK
jgi:glyoxylase-like metal-dependent hydrolase (beta-lactamase superfamily II)